MKISKDEWLKVENQHEPIIDKETFDEVQKIVFERRFIKKSCTNFLNKIDVEKQIDKIQKEKMNIQDYYCLFQKKIQIS